MTKAYLFGQIIVSLGGRAAEILVFGSNEVTQGASNDLENVTRLAREMVTRYGFSPLGPISLESGNNQVFLGRSLLSSRGNIADSTGKAIDSQVRYLAIKAMDQAIDILRPRRAVMDRLVDALIEEETLDNNRFNEIVGII